MDRDTFIISVYCLVVESYKMVKEKYPLRRGGFAPALTDTPVLSFTQSEELIVLDAALNKLAQTDARKSKVVELRYFGGYSDEEIAGLLNVSVRTVARDWHLARSWLYREISSQSNSSEET